MKTIEIISDSDLMKGDHVLIKYRDYWTGKLAIKLFRVVKVQEIGHEIEVVLKVHGNVWFRMSDYLSGNAFIYGRSKLLSVLKIIAL